MVKPFIVKNPFKYLAEKWYRFSELAPYASSYFSLHLLNLYVYRVYFLASINMCPANQPLNVLGKRGFRLMIM